MNFDHRGTDFDAWWNAYTAGEPVGKEEVFAATSGALGRVLTGYRYFKTRGTFLHKNETADQYIVLERGKGTMRLRFGVTHHSVEAARTRLFGPRSIAPKHTPLTISMYSANMGPIGQGWHLPYRVEWPVLGRDGLTLALPEITAFVVETIVPYLAQHTSPQAIRDTFVQAPRHADSWLRSEEIVFAVDHMLGQKERLESDRDALLGRKVAPEDRRRVENAFLQVKSAF